MDIFNEQLIKRKDRPIEKVMKIIIVVIACIAIVLCFLAAILGVFGAFSSLFVLVAFGIGAAAFFYLKSLSIEYEYSLTNGEFDIDKIMGQSKRKRMYSFLLREIEEFGDYSKDKERLQNREFSFRVSPVNLDDSGIYYCVVRDSVHGVGIVLLQPNDKMRESMRVFIPRQVQGNVLSRD